MAKREGERGKLSEIFTRDFLLLATINLAMFFGFQMTNVGLPVYVAQLGANAQIVGLVATVMTITAVVVRIFAGPLLDRFGRKGALVVGPLIMAISIFAYAIFPIVGVILGVRLLQGIGWGLGSTASSTVAADIIPKRRFAEGMGYFAMTTAISSAVAPAFSIMLVQGPGAHYMLYIAGGCSVLAFVIALFQRTSSRSEEPGGADDVGPNAANGKAPTPTGVEGPGTADAGKPSVAGAEESRTPHAGDAHESGQPLKASSSFLSSIFERRAVFPSFLIMLVNIGFGSITTFIALHAQEQGIGQVSGYFVVYAIVTLASRPAIGRLIDRYGFRTPAILSCLCTAATLALIGFSRTMLMLALAGVLGGLGIGTAMGVFQTMAVSAVEPWRRGVATSTYMVAFDIGIAIGSLIGGVIAGAFGYTFMYLDIAIFPFIAGVVSAFAPPSSRRPRDGK